MAIKISEMELVTNVELTDRFEDAQSGSEEATACTMQQILTLLSSYLQTNNGYQELNITAGGTFQLTNPLSSIIEVTGGNVSSPTIRLPALGAANAPKPGAICTVFIFNNTGICNLADSAGNLLYTAGNETGAVIFPYLESNGTTAGTWIVANPLQAENNLIELTNLTQARANLGLGSVATKAVSNNGYSTVPALTGAPISGGEIVVFSIDEDGSIETSGLGINRVLKTFDNLSDVENLSIAQTNMQIIGAQNTQLEFVEYYTNTAVKSVQSGFGSSGLQFEVFSFPTGVTRYVYCQLKMPKRWDKLNFNLIIPWYSDDAGGAGNVVWYVDACIVNVGEVFSDFSFNPPATATSAFSTFDSEIDAGVVDISPGTASIDRPTLLIRIYRQAGVGGDNLPGTARLMNNVIMEWYSNQGNDS